MQKLVTLLTCFVVLMTPVRPMSVCQADDQVAFHHVVVDDQGPPDMHTKTVGDLNGDGRLDLIVAGTKGVIVWYESPGWQKHVMVSAGGGWSTDAEVGDIDGDGDQDLVISDWYQNGRIVWLENPGQGVGEWTLHVIGQPRAHDIELADFDGDGDLDVATRQQGKEGDKIEIWIRQQTKLWQHRAIDCPAGEGLTVCDIDRDGVSDIVIPTRWYKAPAELASGSWDENLYTHQWDHDACVIKTGDMNRDGRPDIVLTPAESKGGSYRIAWYEAPLEPRGNRWTEHPIDDAVETVLHSLDLADLDGDGKLDVVTAEMHQGADPDEVRAYFNPAASGPWAKQVLGQTGSHGIRVLDADADGDVDIFGANWSASTTVDLWLNQGSEKARTSRRRTLDKWTYIEVDDSRKGRAFGLALGDLTSDGYGDIVSGRYFYRNPGGSMTKRWTRTELPIAVDALLAVDVDGDDRGDAIGLASSGELYWLESQDAAGLSWNARLIGNVGKVDHGISSQGYATGDLFSGGKPEIIVNVGTIFVFQIPASPEESPWQRTTVVPEAYPEGVGVGDIDNDGDLDLCGTLDSTRIAWWENPNHPTAKWTAHRVGTMPDKYADRFYAEDLDSDGRLDIVVSAANGAKNGVYWWQQSQETTGIGWQLQTVVLQATTNSMDVADMDGDGDIDIVSGEHRGAEKVAIWENDGRGRFAETVVSTGKESHLGTRLADLDGDGDIDIVSIAWDDAQFMHLWRNDAITTSP